jgi:hypothetical protein
LIRFSAQVSDVAYRAALEQEQEAVAAEASADVPGRELAAQISASCDMKSSLASTPIAA